MGDTTSNSDEILGAANRSLQIQRQGGTHRGAHSIGQESARLKRRHWGKVLTRIGMAFIGIWAAAAAIGLIIDGIGFTGIMLTILATIAAVTILARYPRMKPPKRADLKKGDARAMVGRTELWLEHQRAALPPPAVKIVDQLGLQLDALGIQLENVDQSHPAINEVRELVGEYIPETIDNYRKIPQYLRGEEHAGKTADNRLTESLDKISGEIDRVTRRLAEGSLDDLAIKARYLEYRFGGPEALEDNR